MTDSAATPFEARYSIPKLLGWTLLAAPLATFSAVMLTQGLADGGFLIAILGALGLLFFGGAMAAFLRSMFDRRVQLRIDGDGLLLRAHSAKVIPLRSIKRVGTDQGLIWLLLYKPSRFPIEGRWRRLIYRINGTAAKGFFGDAWIWTAHLNCSKQQVFSAINAHIVPTAFERDLAARIAAADAAQPDG